MIARPSRSTLGEIQQNLDTISQQLASQPDMLPVLQAAAQQMPGYRNMVSVRMLTAQKINVTSCGSIRGGSSSGSGTADPFRLKLREDGNRADAARRA